MTDAFPCPCVFVSIHPPVHVIALSYDKVAFYKTFEYIFKVSNIVKVAR